MKMLSFIEHYLVGVPLAFGIAALSYPFLIWLALRNKNFVKATIWHRNSGFSIEARGEREKGRPLTCHKDRR
jgi:hypothetical protein